MLRLLSDDEALVSAPGVPTVCVPWLDPRSSVSETLSLLRRYTPSHVRVLLAGPAGLELAEISPGLADAGEGEIVGVPLDGVETFSDVCNRISDATGRSDLVLVQPGVQVGPEWLDGLQAAAHCDSTVVSATALCDRASLVSVSSESLIRQDEQFSQPAAALAVKAGSPAARPRIMSAGAHCVFLRRPLLDRLAGFDDRIIDPAEAVTDLTLRAGTLGMVHVAADDVFVLCPPDMDEPASLTHTVDVSDERSVLQRSLACARVALRGMSVTIDARAVGPGVGGTQLYTVQLVLALAATEQLRVRVVVAPGLPDVVAHQLAESPGLEVIGYDEVIDGVVPSDIVHRPQQVFTEDDLRLLHLLGERVVVGQQDLISYRNASYHATIDGWLQYRRVTRLALAVADRAVFFSEHAMRDAVAEDLVSRQRCDVAGVGTDGAAGSVVVPRPVTAVGHDQEMLVCLGADYRHKNRAFAIELLAELRSRHNWRGRLVLAGAHVPYGSSREEEEALLDKHPDLGDAVVDVGPIDEAERSWLYGRAAAVVYPSVYEGFGLIPFEAALVGTPCLFAPQASLVELAGPQAPTLVPWNAQLSADKVAPLLTNGPARTRHVELLRRGAQSARWDDVVRRLLDTYRAAIDAPQRAAAPRAWQEAERERYIAHLGKDVEHVKAVAEDCQHAYSELKESVGFGLPLVAHGGLLNRDEQRGLMRIASRRLPRRIVLAPIAALGRLGVSATGASLPEGAAPAAMQRSEPDDDANARW